MRRIRGEGLKGALTHSFPSSCPLQDGNRLGAEGTRVLLGALESLSGLGLTKLFLVLHATRL